MMRKFGVKSWFQNADLISASVESADNQIICLMRLLLAVTALTIIYIDPTSPDRFVGITYAVLITYCLYSAAIYFLSRQAASLSSADAIPWIDLAWYLVIVGLSNGTNSIFFFFFYFSIFVAAFRSGFGAGIQVTIAAAVLFSIIGYGIALHTGEFELNRFLIRPICLMMLGYMISFWGGKEIKFKRRLLLLKDVNRLSNPRFGINRTLSDIMNRLRAFYDAESCILITFGSSPETCEWREASSDKSDEDLSVEQTEAVAPLINLPGERAIFHQTNHKLWNLSPNDYAYDISTGEEAEISADSRAAIADLLNAESFLSVPVKRRGEMVGRLYLTSCRSRFDRSELEFVSQLTEQLLTALENVDLLNRLASGAAERQRQKISSDLHDSTVQPYIGLKLGLEALEIKHAAGAAIGNDLKKLIKLTDSTIAELRGFVKQLKTGTEDVKGSILIPAVKQQLLKFHEFYDINISVEAVEDFQINDCLAAEAFQIISEGLSNIKRHTKAKQGTIRIRRDNEKLFLEIENDNKDSGATPEFLPKSIAGRAKSLGGVARVERLDNQTKLLVEIPL